MKSDQTSWDHSTCSTRPLIDRLTISFMGGDFTDIYTVAAQPLFGICRNHPFVDGNKRVALFAMTAFLLLNGWELSGESDLIALVINTAEGIVDISTIAASPKNMSFPIKLQEDRTDDEGAPELDG